MNALPRGWTACGALLALVCLSCSEAPETLTPPTSKAREDAAPKAAATWVREIALDAEVAGVVEVDGGYVLAGTTAHPERGDKDMLLIRVDAVGGEVWRRIFGGTDKEYAYGVAATGDGGFIVSGQTSSFKDYGGDAFVVRTAGDGEERWAKSYGAAGTDAAVAALPGTDGGFHVFGRTYQGGNGLEIYWIEIDSNGELIRERTLGGADDQYLAAAASLSDGAFMLACVDGRFNLGELRPLLMKVNGAGDIAWKAAIDIAGAVHTESVALAVTTSGGAVYAAGVFPPPESDLGARPLEREPAEQNIQTTAVDKDGAITWTSHLRGEGWDAPRAVIGMADGGVALAGTTRAYGAGGKDVFLIRLDDKGNETWAGTIGGADDEMLHAAIAISDGGFLLVGDESTQGGRRLRLIKTDGTGQALVDGQPLRSDGLQQREVEQAPAAPAGTAPTFINENAPQVGEEAPEIHVGAWFNSEQPLSLEGLRGKVVVLEFWATWCGPCRHSTPHLVALSEQYADKGVVFVGLTDEDPAAAPVEDFIAEFSIPYPVGAQSTTISAYGVTGIPTAFVIDTAGVIRWIGHPMDELAAQIDAILAE